MLSSFLEIVYNSFGLESQWVSVAVVLNMGTVAVATIHRSRKTSDFSNLGASDRKTTSGDLGGARNVEEVSTSGLHVVGCLSCVLFYQF